MSHGSYFFALSFILFIYPFPDADDVCCKLYRKGGIAHKQESILKNINEQSSGKNLKF